MGRQKKYKPRKDGPHVNQGLPPGYRNALPPGRLEGTLIALHVPCGCTVYYPVVLAQAAMIERTAHALPVICDHTTAHIVTTEPDGAHFRLSGPPASIDHIYTQIPWPEDVLRFPGSFPDGHACKRAPSVEALRTYFANL